MAEGLKRQSANNVRERFRLTARRISPLKETRASVKLLHEALAIRPAQSGNAPALENNKGSRQAMVKMAKPAPVDTRLSPARAELFLCSRDGAWLGL
jgi:hypothetical protein